MRDGSFAVALLLAVALLGGSCSQPEAGGPGEDRLAVVRAAGQKLAEARARLAAAPPQPELADARADFDRAYERYQRLLADYLAAGLSSAPQAEGTREAVRLYTDEALRHAGEVRARGGDLDPARALLRSAEEYHRVAGMAVPPALKAELRRP